MELLKYQPSTLCYEVHILLLFDFLFLLCFPDLTCGIPLLLLLLCFFVAVDIDRLPPVKERVQEGHKMSTESPQSGQVVWVAVHLELVRYLLENVIALENYTIWFVWQNRAGGECEFLVITLVRIYKLFAFKFLSCPLFFVFIFLIIQNSLYFYHFNIFFKQ